MAGNLRDKAIFRDFSVWISPIVTGTGPARMTSKIGECPSFQPPEINLAVEEYRGGGMDGTIDIPHGVEKIEFSFDVHTWEPDIWERVGYGFCAQTCFVEFRGYMMSPDCGETSMRIETRSLVRAVKPSSIDAGGKSTTTVDLTAHYYNHYIGGESILEIDIFSKIFKVRGVDRNQFAREALGFGRAV